METLKLLLKVLWAPGEAMFLASKQPRVLIPLVTLGFISLIGASVSFTKIDAGQMALRQLERSGRAESMTEEQKDAIMAASRRFAPVFIASSTLGPAVVITIMATIYFGVFTIIGRDGSFKAFYSITAFAYFPIVFRQIAATLQVWFVPPAALVPQELGSLSLAVFMDPASVSRLTYAVAGFVDVISIWTLILLMIGFKFLTRKSAGTSARIAGVLGVYLVFSAAGVAIRMVGAQ